MSQYYNLFKPQCFSLAEEDEAIRNNMTIDYSFGHVEIVRSFVKKYPQFSSYLQILEEMDQKTLSDKALGASKASLLMTVLMLTGKCNADCPICYTDRKAKKNELQFDEIRNIIDQSYDLGSRLIYIPGEGEPTLDGAFFRVLEYARIKGMVVICFSNGLLFSNDQESRHYWGVDSEDLVKSLAHFPVYIYHKLWTLNEGLLSEMMNISPGTYEMESVNVSGLMLAMPKGLTNLLRWFPRERVGVEVLVQNRNVREIAETIIPLIQNLGIRSYIEPIIHSGRCFGHFENDVLFDDQSLVRVSPWLARQKCKRVAYKLTVRNDGYVTIGMAVKPDQIVQPKEIEQLNVRDVDGCIKDIHQMLHSNRSLVQGRYEIGVCMCEELNLRLAQKAQMENCENVSCAVIAN